MLARNTYDRSAGLSGLSRAPPPKPAAETPEEYDFDDDDDIEEDEEQELDARTPLVRQTHRYFHWHVRKQEH